MMFSFNLYCIFGHFVNLTANLPFQYLLVRPVNWEEQSVSDEAGGGHARRCQTHWAGPTPTGSAQPNAHGSPSGRKGPCLKKSGRKGPARNNWPNPSLSHTPANPALPLGFEADGKRGRARSLEISRKNQN